ncbi:MAG: hypothetical protein ACRDQ7_16605 [Haloechinothrix sp.]
MEYSDADLAGIDLPQAVCWERLKYDILPAIDIPCRVEVTGRRLKTPVVRARLRTLASDDIGYFHTVQIYLHRVVPLGAFGPKFGVYCQADGRSATLLQLRADSDGAFQSKGVTRFLAWSYGVQWRMAKRIDDEGTDTYLEFLRKVRVYFDDAPIYDFGQLTREGLNDGFHRRGYAYLAELLRAELVKTVR